MGAALIPGPDERDDVLTSARSFKGLGEVRLSGARPRLDQLQVLRFAAASAVMLFHWWGSLTSVLGIERNYFVLGADGVDVFFVLSGFIIAYSTRPERGASYFAVRRIARIVPLYWALTLAVAAVAVLLPQLLNSTTFSWGNLLRSLFFIPYQKENGLVQPMLFLGWTLNYEMFFYFIFALTLSFRNWSAVYPCGIIVALVLLGRLISLDSVVWRFYTDPIILEFVFGVLLFRAWTARGAEFARYRGALLAASILLFALSLNVESYLLRPFVPGIAATCLTGAVLSLTVPRGRFWEILVLCGNASYSLYLIHPYVLQAFTKALSNDPSAFFVFVGSVAAIAISIASSVALYLALELNAQRLILAWWSALSGEKRSRPC